MARDTGDFAAILQSVVAELIATPLLAVNSATCYLSLSPGDVTPDPSSGDFVFVVAPDLDGQFDEAQLDGGMATLGTGVLVAIHAPVRIDQSGRDTEFLVNDTLGVLGRWQTMLKALTNFSPVAGGDEQTRDPLLPSGFSIRKRKNSIGSITTRFKLVFDALNLLPD